MQQIKADLMEKKNMTAAQASNMIYSGGLQIHTTMDASMQETAEAAMKNDNMFPAGDGEDGCDLSDFRSGYTEPR